MQTRSLGSSNIQIVPLVLGGNVFGWTADAPTSFRVLDAFVDRGFNFIDTAGQRLLPVAARQSRRRVRNHPRPVVSEERHARQSRPRHQGRQRHGRRQAGPQQKVHSPEVERSRPRSSAFRPTISISTSPTRTTNPRPSRRRSKRTSNSSSREKCASSAHRTTAKRPPDRSY